jgi:hypothetical protein
VIRRSVLSFAFLGAAILSVTVARPQAQSTSGAATKTGAANSVAIDADDIGGVVTGEKGPEAGVWVIAVGRVDVPVRRGGSPGNRSQKDRQIEL